MERFLGVRRAASLLREFIKSQNITTIIKGNKNDEKIKLTEVLNQPLKSEMITFVETRLAGAIGQASAKVMISGVLKSGDLNDEDVVQIIDEAANIRRYSDKLEKKSQAMAKEGMLLREEFSHLQKVDRQKDDYIATLSHELRTPLTSIRTFSELMLTTDDLSTDEKTKFLTVVISETDRLSRMINQILDLAKIESGQFHWHKKEYLLLDIVQDSIDAIYPLYHDKKVRLILNEIEIDSVVFVDRDRLMQVLQNLLANALKFCSSETGIVIININRYKSINNFIQVSVSDNGRGIPTEDLENIFIKYHQSLVNQKDNTNGTGLGLPISRHIIENFGGKIWAENSINSQDEVWGTRLFFILPIVANN